MYRKLITPVAGLAIAASLGGSAIAAPNACPELRTACQPTGDRANAQKPKPRAQTSWPKLTPRVDSSGQLWRVGDHIMQ
jgi:hypothetical protein